MKKITLLIMLLAGLTMSAQESIDKPDSKIDIFMSKTGVIKKFIDYNFDPLKSSFDVHEARVRRVIVGSESKFFFQLVNSGKYGSKTASIEYGDLLEVIKALNNLKNSLESDINLSPDYLENKFVTTDHFEIGYYISKEKARWALKLGRYGSDNTIILDEVTNLEELFIKAKNKIEELKK